MTAADARAVLPMDAGTVTPPVMPAPLPAGEVRCGESICPVGFMCCPERGCVPEGDDPFSACLLCDDDADCDARGVGGVCCEGPFAIGGGVRWQCTAEPFACLRVCNDGGCLTWRESGPPPIGQVECDSGALGWRTCAVGEACCDNACVPRADTYPDGSGCSECNTDSDCAALDLGSVCCSVSSPRGYLGRRCRPAGDDCWDG